MTVILAALMLATAAFAGSTSTTTGLAKAAQIATDPVTAPATPIPSGVRETDHSVAQSFTIRPPSGLLLPRIIDGGPAPIRKTGTADPLPSTEHFMVVDGASGAILFERNGFDPVAPASTTKVMTAILGVEYGRLDEQVQLDVDAGSMPGSSLMGLEPWFDVTVQDLLYGLMLVSGNDAALAIARYVSGTDEAFVRLMNEKAAWLGLKATHFANPHGLDASDHYSSPYDMVAMARYGMQYPVFRQVVGARTYDVNSSNLALLLDNLNPLLGFPGADGVKTGLTDSAGRALVGTAVQNGHRVYVAFMRSENGAAADGAYLLRWAFDSFEWPDGRLGASR